ncbi:hypothetical protein SCQ32_09960 [Streptococcus canis]|uniref:hypothetical protein n=1 Tax=Streptococcus canis TaxID=1329 RepID=UPI002994081B|nr:hypothetical protein [Streptococcus canis]
MDLDFSKLDSLGSPQKPADTSITTDYTKLPETPKKPAEAKIGTNTHTLQRQADNRKKQLEDSAGVLREYQANKRLTNSLVSEITKGVQQSIDIYDLFLKAVEALALVTNETALYERTRQDLKAIYGIGLKENRILEIEIEDTQKRLEHLTQALKNADRAEDKERLKNAVTAHQKHLETLQG